MSTQRSDCEKGLGYAVIERAVEDYKEFVEEGVIVGGKVYPERWPLTPSGSRRKILGCFTHPAQVRELVHFFEGDNCKDWLELLDSDIDQERIYNSVKKYSKLTSNGVQAEDQRKAIWLTVMIERLEGKLKHDSTQLAIELMNQDYSYGLTPKESHEKLIQKMRAKAEEERKIREEARRKCRLWRRYA